MAEDRLITIAIHTYEKAIVLRSLLESQGVEVALHNVNLLQPVVSSGVRVRIHESDLPKALRIIEEAPALGSDDPDQGVSEVTTGPGRDPVLVPVDFSAHSEAAAHLAFTLAASYGVQVELLHSYITPSLSQPFQLSNSFDFDFENLGDDEVRISIEEASHKQLDAFAARLAAEMERGKLPAVKFSTELVDDVPEDAILQRAREIKPRLIVMGTRGAGRKEREMIGSVTAEVLDASRVPVLTVPDTWTHSLLRPSDDCRALFFCSYEQHDLLALDLFYRLFPNARFHVTLCNVPSKRVPISADGLGETLAEYCREHMPRFTFDVRTLQINDMEAEYQALERQGHIHFLAVPTRHRNMLARLFNPSLAHRLLFHADIPLLTLPV